MFFCFKNTDDSDPNIEFIDMESVNDFSHSTGSYNNIISKKYDFPFKLKRSKIIFKDKNNALDPDLSDKQEQKADDFEKFHTPYKPRRRY